MKNLFLKTIAIALFLLVIPIKQYGQDVRNHFIELEVESITNPDYRFCLLSSIANDANYNYIINDDNMSVLLSSTEHWSDAQFQSYFNKTKFDAEANFNDYLSDDKETQGELFSTWKDNLPQDLFVLLFKQMLIENPTNRDGNQTCATSEPFCTIDGITFHVDANPSGSCEIGPAYGCLSSYIARRPYWYHMKISVAGAFTIRMTNSANVDIDYCCWGPFDDPVAPCPNQLQTIVDCGSSGAATENCHIPSSAQVGKYYIMVITKWNQNTPTDITFTKVANSGPGETDCGILPGVATNGGPYCVGDVIQLNVNAQEGATYSWTGPGGYTSNQQNPTRPNCTLAMAGSYTCTTTVGTHSVTASTDVQVFPKPTANFSASSVCQGNPTQFTNTSTTNPANQTMNYQWNFGDGNTSNQQSPSHQYVSAGNYNVTLTVSCGNGTCTSSKTQNVTVYPNPVANAGEDQTVYYGDPATLSGSGGSGTFNYHWEPADKVVNPNAQTTQTVGLQQSTTFTLTVTHPQGGCSSTDQVSVLVQGSHMTATASASPTSICLDENSQLNAIGIGGTGNYTYAWTPTIGLSSPNIANPVAHPTETTTYSCLVNDGLSSQTVTTTVTVNYPEYEEVEQWICPDTTYTFYGQEYSAEDDYEYVTTTANGCEKIITLHLHHYQDYPNAHTTTEYICPGTSVQFYGHYYSNPGRYPKAFETIHGCDSIVWLDLNVYPANDTIDVEGNTCIGKPYLYHGVEYTENTDMYFDTIDDNGCLLVEHFRLTVGEYQTPPNYEPNKFICYDYGEEPEYYWDIAGRTYHENAIDSIILPGPAGECDYKYMLNLKFHSRFFNEIDTTVCNMFEWEVDHNTYNTSQRLYKNFQIAGGSQFKCDSIYIVNLTVNHDKDTTFNVSSCNQYVWQFSNAGTDTIIKHPGTYTKTILTHQGCDSIGTLNLQLDYSPTFDLVEGHSWVVGGSEFQFTVEDYWINTQGSHITSWELRDKDDNPFTRWDLLPYGDNFDRCLVYIFTYELDTIYIHATTRSTGQGNEFCGDQPFSMRKMIICSSYGTPEITQHCSADIYPNPNDGNMTLSFTNMPGDIVVKVFNIQGAQIDQFQVHNGYESSTYPYNSNRLAPGVYFFSFINRTGSLNKKVIITK